VGHHDLELGTERENTVTESVEAVLKARTGRAQRTRTPAVVTSPKNSAAYRAHSYPTKIPPEAIVPFIEASTTPGAIVFDPFCGSGMSGVAAQQTGRSVILSDLSPGAVHLATNHNRPADPDVLMTAVRQLDQDWMSSLESQLYATTCPTCDGAAVTRHTIWSDVHRCGGCGREVVLWDEADLDTGSVPRWVDCECGASLMRGGAVPLRSEPVHRVVACRSGCAYLQDGEVPERDARLLRRLEKARVEDWFPEDVLDTSREMYKRSALHLRGIATVADFYLPRAKHALTALWARINEVEDAAVRSSLRFAFTNTAWHASRMRRYNARGGQRPLTGTLFIPQLTAEANAFEVFRHQVKQIAAFARGFVRETEVSVAVERSSAADLAWLPDNSIDYVFTDPPFGSNIFYADCNFVWEAWLGEVTDADAEVVVNRSRTADEGGKSVEDYGDLLRQAFCEIRRVLRPDGRASVVFHNSDDRVWTAMLRAAEDAGLKQTEVSILDKVQRSMKGYKGRDGSELVPFYDLVITFAPGKVRSPHLNGAGEIALEVVRKHLKEADRSAVAASAQERSLEYLYSLAVGGVVAQGAIPEGLSYRAFEELCGRHFERTGRHFSVI
jgi:predicted RNA methylase